MADNPEAETSPTGFAHLRHFPEIHFADLILTLPPFELLVFACWQATVVTAHIQGIFKIERNW